MGASTDGRRDLYCADLSGNRDTVPPHTRRWRRVKGMRYIACFAVLFVLQEIAVSHASESPMNPSQTPILLGMSTALTGPAAHLGMNMRDGVLAALQEANAHGGIHGRKLELIVLDDSYEPSKTVPNIHRLINEDNVLAIVGNVGTPTAVAALPIINMHGAPFFGAFTGAGVLRKTPPDHYVINYRASYMEETTAMVDALIEKAGLRPTELAFFTQRDTYGDAGYAGGIAALLRHGLKDEHDIPHGRYERNTEAVENGLADILFHDDLPKAIIMVGAYAPCAKFIRLAKECGVDALFLNVSFVGTMPLIKALGAYGEGTIITQVVPHYKSDLPAVRAYREALGEMGNEVEPSFGSLEGYVATRVFLKALADIHKMPTQEGMVEALERLGVFDIGLGVPLRLDPDEHQACHTVWPTIISGDTAVPMDWEDLKRIAGGGKS